jgi:predicted GIY-YIG superfamily endonuclease
MDIQLEDYLLKGFSVNKTYIYVLKLKQDKYYVGKAKNFVSRIMFHNAKWTKLYEPISIIELVEDKDNLEKEKTIEYMKLYGWKNVRGYAWSKIEMKNPPKELFNL